MDRNKIKIVWLAVAVGVLSVATIAAVGTAIDIDKARSKYEKILDLSCSSVFKGSGAGKTCKAGVEALKAMDIKDIEKMVNSLY